MKNSVYLLILITIGLLSIGCTKTKSPFNIRINNKPVQANDIANLIDTKKYEGNLQATSTKDGLPAYWSSDDEVHFYTIKEFQIDAHKYLIYAMTGSEKTDLQDFRIATIKNDTILYNFPLGVNPAVNHTQAMVTINENKKLLELFRDDQLIMKYLPEVGEMERMGN